MQEILLDYGDTYMPIELPDTADVVRYNQTYTDPPEVDAYEAIKTALENPIGFPPLRELGGSDKTGRFNIGTIIPLEYDPILACRGAADLVFDWYFDTN